MVRFVVLISILLNSCAVLAQLNIPLNSLDSKVELKRFRTDKSDTLLYATVYSDRVNKYRLWIFYDSYDSSTTDQKASDILFEVFDEKNNIRKQIFLSQITSTIQADSKWEVVDFLSSGYGEVDDKLLKFLKKQIAKTNFESLSVVNNLFNRYSVAAIRESRYSLHGSWLSALQTNPNFHNYSHSDWMTLEPYYAGRDTMKITQKWKLLGTEYNTYHLTRTAIKNRLEYIEAVFNDYSTNFRRYEYGNDLKLKQIMEGRLVNDSEEIEHIILVVPY